MLKHDAGDKKLSVWGEQNFDEDKNNQIGSAVVNTLLNSGVFFHSKLHIGQKESEILIFLQISSIVIYKHTCMSFSFLKKS